MSTTTKPRRPQSKVWLVAASGLAIVALLAALSVWLLGGLTSGGNNQVKSLLTNSSSLNPQENTARLCETILCNEGWTTTGGDFLQFDSEGEAEQFATYLGDDGRRWKNVVLDMRDKDLTFEDKKMVIDTLYSKKDWS